MEIFTLTKKKRTGNEKALSVVLLILAILFLAATYVILYSFIVGVVLAVICYWSKFKRYYEFEVSYFDGDFKIVKVINMSRRKKVLVFSMDDVIQIAPANDRSIYNHENNPHVKKIDAYSLEEDVVPYAIAIKQGSNLFLAKVELDDRMLDEMCKKYQQKVIR